MAHRPCVPRRNLEDSSAPRRSFQCGPERPAKFPEGNHTEFFSRNSREKSGYSREKSGLELKHDILTGVLGHVNGMGQCFIDTRNTLNEVAENSKVTRNKIINALLKNPTQMLGLQSA
jgi:hypothetical protein